MTRKKIIDINDSEIHNDERAPRVLEARAFDEREAHRRAAMDLNYADPLYFDEKEIPAGQQYHWVRESCLDKADFGRTEEMQRKGWSPVPIERHPSRCKKDLLGRPLALTGYIMHRGLVLCERAAELGILETTARNKRNAQIMHSMPGTENFMIEPSIPANNFSKTYS